MDRCHLSLFRFWPNESQSVCTLKAVCLTFSFFFALTVGPLDRGCQNLIFPACKNLGFYNHTIFAESVQKKFYKIFYNKTYGDGQDLDQDFPLLWSKQAAKFPDCSTDIKKLFCGELFPPCFPEEGSPKLKTLCRSVCDDIQRKCPDFFR